MSQIEIGINPLTWSNDDLPTLGGETSLEQCLREGRQAGYAGFELGNKFPRDPKVLGPILAQHDLKLASGWFSGGVLAQSAEAEIAALQPHLHLLKSLGCKTVVYCDITGTVQGQRQTPLSHRPVLDKAAWKGFAERLTRVADHMAEQGLSMAYHFHMGTVVQYRHEVDRLMSLAGESVKLLLDTGHLYFAGGDPVDFARSYGERIAHVHCKDMRGKILSDCLNRDASFIDTLLSGAFAVPGDGVIDYPAVLNALKQADYHGWLIVEAEQDPVVAPSLATATRGFDYLHRAAQDAGLCA